MIDPDASLKLRRTLVFVLIAAPAAVILGGVIGALVLEHDGYERGVVASSALVGALVGFWILISAARAVLLAIPARGVPPQEVMARMLSLDRRDAARDDVTWRRRRTAALATWFGGQTGIGAMMVWAPLVDEAKWAITIGFYVASVAVVAWIAIRAAAEEVRELAALGLTGAKEPPAHRDQVRPERFRTGESVWPKDTVYRGTRHGRAVYIRVFAEGASLVRVAPLVAAPTLRAPGGRCLRAALTPFGALAVAASSLPESAEWEGCEVASGPGGIEVTRVERGRGGRFWLYDLWLAERLAHALDGGGSA